MLLKFNAFCLTTCIAKFWGSTLEFLSMDGLMQAESRTRGSRKGGNASCPSPREPSHSPPPTIKKYSPDQFNYLLSLKLVRVLFKKLDTCVQHKFFDTIFILQTLKRFI